MDDAAPAAMGPPPAPPATGKGRPRQRKVAADTQIDRKRELDRIAQRMSRERSRNRIAFLEQKLMSLEARDRGGQISSLMKVIEDLRRDNTSLRASMMKIKFIADDLGEPGPSPVTRRLSEDDGSQSTLSPQDSTNQDPNTPHVNLNSNGGNMTSESQLAQFFSQEQYQASTSTALVGVKEGTQFRGHPNQHLVDYNEADFMADLDNFEATIAAWSQPQFDWDFTNSSGPLPLAADIEKWNYSDSTLVRAMELCRTTALPHAGLDPTLDPDVPVKAILWGWHTIDAKQRHHPVWEALRQIDESVFGTWTFKPQKIAMMYVCQLMLQYRAFPSKENLERLPAWFRPRPSQERVEHPLLVDFLIWPGLRDLLVFSHRKYASNAEFSRHYVEDLRFHWPHSDSDIFTYDPWRRIYAFSTLFKQATMDMRNWTMDVKFFEAFEEMIYDIPVSDDRATVMV